MPFVMVEREAEWGDSGSWRSCVPIWISDFDKTRGSSGTMSKTG